MPQPPSILKSGKSHPLPSQCGRVTACGESAILPAYDGETMDDVKLALISTLTELLKRGAFPEVDAVVAGGSVGRGEDDVLSDLDLFMLLAPGCDLRHFLDSGVSSMTNDIGKRLLLCGPQRTGKFAHSFTALYQPRQVLSLHVYERHTLQPDPMDALPNRMLFDRSGYYSDFMAAASELVTNEVRLLSQTFSRYLLRGMSIAKDVQRGDLWLAVQHLAELRDLLIVIERLTIRIPPPGLNFDRPAKGVEKAMPAEFLSLLHRTLAVPDLDAIASALEACNERFIASCTAIRDDLRIPPERDLSLARRLCGEMLEDIRQ